MRCNGEQIDGQDMAAIEDGRPRFRIDMDGPGAGIAIMILTTAAFAARISSARS